MMMNQMMANRHMARESRTAVRAGPELNEEETYGIEELFFSRTDKRGVIEAYNETFRRIAGFDSGELQGAPHKLVRHSDMPKAVFWLLWNGLKHGVPVGAYVKNKTKEGKYYWVFAMASPIEDGYLSVRLQPSSALFANVQSLYTEILQDEQELNLSPEDSAHRLLSRVKDLGFPTYAMFQAHAFYTEFEARRETLQRPKNTTLSSVDVITSNAQVLRRELGMLAERCEGASLLTTNLTILANKQQQGQGVLRAISNNYSLKLHKMQELLATVQVTEDYAGIWDVSREQNAYFMLCASYLMEEMCDQFEKQDNLGADAASNASSAQDLQQLLNDYKRESVKAVLEGVQAAVETKKHVELLGQLIATLSSIRISCQVELARLTDKVGGLDDVLTGFDAFHDDVDRHLRKILAAANEVLKGVDQSTATAS